jgi:Zn-dependent protease
MKGSFQIARFANIPVLVHWSFALIFLWVVYVGFQEGWEWKAIGWSVLFVIALFVCVVLHEFGHALTARRYGVRTRDIILSPIGGVARLDRLPENPMQEFYVAVAGPMVNVGIMAALSPYFLLVSSATREQLLSILRQYVGISDNVFVRDLTPFDFFIFGLVMLNGMLAVFNMLPAFPMDGGRVLRALLSIPLGRMKATRIAAWFGQFLAVLLVLYGFREGSPITIFIGIFVFFMAANEYRMVRIDDILSKHTVADVLRPVFTRFYEKDTMERVAEAVAHGWEKHFIIVDEWQRPVGTLPEERIVQAVQQGAFDEPAEKFMLRGADALRLQDSLRDVFMHVQQHNTHLFPVYDHAERLVGVLDTDMLFQFIKMRQRPRFTALRSIRANT